MKNFLNLTFKTIIMVIFSPFFIGTIIAVGFLIIVDVVFPHTHKIGYNLKY